MDIQVRILKFLNSLKPNRTPNNIGNKNIGISDIFRFDSIFIEKLRLEKLIRTMKYKAPNSKLTSLLSVIIADSFKRVCLKYKASMRNLNLNGVYFLNETKYFQLDICLKDFEILVSISLRDKLAISNLQMGCNVQGTISKIKFQNDLKQNQKILWSLAEKDSISLHNHIRNNKQLKTSRDQIDLLNFLFNNDLGQVAFKSNFLISNYGIMHNTKNKRVVGLEEFYVSLPSPQIFCPNLFFHPVTINGNLNLSISFNEKIFSLEFIQDLKKEISEEIDFISNLTLAESTLLNTGLHNSLRNAGYML